MATIAIGDIHGNLHTLNDLLKQLRLEIAAGDTVVFLGDYIDRGPFSKECIDCILEFRDRGHAIVVTLLGNHEDWMLRSLRDPTRHSWLLGMEAFETIASYSFEAAQELRRAAAEAGPRLITERISLPYDVFFSEVPNRHLAFFKALVPYHRTPEAICVHGGLDPRITALEEQPVNACVWGTNDFATAYAGADTVIYGHWNNCITDALGRPHPYIQGRTVGIDTISHGVLTAYKLPDRQVFQSRRD